MSKRADWVKEVVSASPATTNYVSAINEAGNGWVQLSPFGDFNNEKGMQRVRPEDAEATVNEFNSVRALPTKMLGLPVYIGHPDVPKYQAKYSDQRAYGRIKELESRSDANCKACNEFCSKVSTVPCPDHGLFGRIKWSQDGKSLINDEAFSGHSVNWNLAREGGFIRPRQLVSLGLTNEANIPSAPITTANEKETLMFEKIKQLLGLTPEATETDCESKIVDLAAVRAANEKATTDLTAAQNEVATLKEAAKTREEDLVAVANELLAFGDTPEKRTAYQTEAAKAKTDLVAAQATITAKDGELKAANEWRKKETDAYNTVLLAQAVAEGRVTKAQQKEWESKFAAAANEADTAKVRGDLGKAQMQLHVAQLQGTKDLGARNCSAQDNASNCSKFQAEVDRIRHAENCSYNDAFAKAKETPAGKAAWESMK